MYSRAFDIFRKSRVVQLGCIIGNIDTVYKLSELKNIEKITKLISKYNETGDAEYLLHIANLAMMEYMKPQHSSPCLHPVRNIQFLQSVYIGK